MNSSDYASGSPTHFTPGISNIFVRLSCILFLQGPAVDVVVDTGLGVCNLREHLVTQGLIAQDRSRECIAIITHNHFDHSGGARDFDNVLIHQDDWQGKMITTFNLFAAELFGHFNPLHA